MGEACCHLLPWDTEFFGVRIGRVTAPAADASTMDALLAEAGAQRMACLYYLVDPDERTCVRLAESRGFQFMGTRLTLEASPAASREAVRPPADVRLTACEPTDLPHLERLSKNAYRMTRYFRDERFRARAPDLYHAWTEKCCQESPETVVVARASVGPVGYLAWQHEGLEASILLVAVDAGMRGQGIASALISHALARMQEAGATGVTVVTQGENLSAQRLYIRAGFVAQEARYWYHLWLTPEDFKDTTS